MSVSNVSDVKSLTDGKSAQSTSGNTQVVSLSGGISTMGSSGGMTCYKAACSSGYYLDAPNSTYFTSTSTTGTIGLTCYKATGCKSGYYNGGSSYSYHGYYCSKCTYSCPDGYSTSTTSSSCGSGYTLKTVSASTQSGCPAKQCGKCEKESSTPSKCSDTGYYDGYSCSTWGSYPTSRDCYAGYSELATSDKCYSKVSNNNYCSQCNGLGGDDAAACYGRCYGDCDVDSWHRCCQQCNGGSV